MKLFKLTEQDNTTYHKTTVWGENVTHKKNKKDNPSLCSSDVLHAYSNATLAFLLNPIHANIHSPRLWEASGKVVCSDFGKVGCFKLTTLRELSSPTWVGSAIDAQVRTMFAALCAESVLSVFEDTRPSDTRVREAINAAKQYAITPSKEAAGAAAEAAGAGWAARAAEAAARAAEAGWAASAAEAAARAASAASAAARAAAECTIDFTAIADNAVSLIIAK